MIYDEDNFFSRNVLNINNIILKIFIFSNMLPLIIIPLSIAGIFSVNHFISLSFLIVTSLFTLTDYFLIKFCRNQNIALWFGLCSLELFIAFAGANMHVGIYITYGLVPILTSLLYDKKLSLKICLFSYLLTLASLYIKFLQQASIFTDSSVSYSFRNSYIPVAIGFTIEYIFISIVSLMLTERNYMLLSTLMTTIRDRKEFFEKSKITAAQIESKNRELQETQFKIIQFVAECLGSHDLFTGRHVLHTKEYVSIISKKLRDNGYYTDILTDETILLYSSAAFLHDIGKIHIPEGILNKVGKFTDEEFERMKSHPDEGRKLLEFLPKIDDGSFNEKAIQMAHCHHEKWNGTGYPRRISGNDIPLCARIMAAADVLDALISQRLYKEPMSIDEAMKVFEESKGSHFEPCIAEAVIDCRDTIQVIDSQFKEEESAENNKELQWWYCYHNISTDKK